MEPPEEVQVAVSKREKRYYKVSQYLFLIGVIVLMIAVMALSKFMPDPTSISTLGNVADAFPSLPRISLSWSVALLIFSLISIVASVKEISSLNVNSEEVFLDEVNIATQKYDAGDKEEAIHQLDSAFSGSTPPFVTRSVEQRVKSYLSELKKSGDFEGNDHTFEKIVEYVYEEKQDENNLIAHLDTATSDLQNEREENDDVPNLMATVGDIFYRQVIGSTTVKYALFTSLVIISIIVAIFLTLIDYDPLATFILTLLGMILSAIITNRFLGSNRQ